MAGLYCRKCKRHHWPGQCRMGNLQKGKQKAQPEKSKENQSKEKQVDSKSGESGPSHSETTESSGIAEASGITMPQNIPPSQTPIRATRSRSTGRKIKSPTVSTEVTETPTNTATSQTRQQTTRSSSRTRELQNPTPETEFMEIPLGAMTSHTRDTLTISEKVSNMAGLYCRKCKKSSLAWPMSHGKVAERKKKAQLEKSKDNQSTQKQVDSKSGESEPSHTETTESSGIAEASGITMPQNIPPSQTPIRATRSRSTGRKIKSPTVSTEVTETPTNTATSQTRQQTTRSSSRTRELQNPTPEIRIHGNTVMWCYDFTHS